MRLRVLSVAYPFAPVAPATAGGAEQVLWTLDRALCRAGHDSVVIACVGSELTGELVPLPRPEGDIGGADYGRGHARCLEAIAGVLARRRVDVIHLHGVDFHNYLPAPGLPTLVTLHMPLSFYPPAALRPERPDTWLHGVSAAQHAAAPPGTALLPPIENGVDLAAFAGRHARRRFALMLTRICPEKGVHLALDAAKAADCPLLIAGDLFPYAAHRAYFEAEVRPRLDERRRWIGPVGPARKRRLLQAARCVLIPSLAEETSSLVAREAAAAGTAVIAFRRGALPEAIADGRTGFLVADASEMAAAIGRVDAIRPEDCRSLAAARFDAETMTGRYLRLYADLARRALGGAA